MFSSSGFERSGSQKTLGRVEGNFKELRSDSECLILRCDSGERFEIPRATEFLYLVRNSRPKTGFIEENEARSSPMARPIPQANFGCGPLTFVAVLNDGDPGASQAAQQFFGLPTDVVGATLGDIGVQQVVGLTTGTLDNLAIGIDSCLQKCNIQRGQQTMKQQQPRGDGNAFPS